MMQIKIGDPRSLRPWHIKGSDESTLGKDSSIHLIDIPWSTWSQVTAPDSYRWLSKIIMKNNYALLKVDRHVHVYVVTFTQNPLLKAQLVSVVAQHVVKIWERRKSSLTKYFLKAVLPFLAHQALAPSCKEQHRRPKVTNWGLKALDSWCTCPHSSSTAEWCNFQACFKTQIDTCTFSYV